MGGCQPPSYRTGVSEFPRRTLLGSSLIKPARIRPGTVEVAREQRSAKYYPFLVCLHT